MPKYVTAWPTNFGMYSVSIWNSSQLAWYTVHYTYILNTIALDEAVGRAKYSVYKILKYTVLVVAQNDIQCSSEASQELGSVCASLMTEIIRYI